MPTYTADDAWMTLEQDAMQNKLLVLTLPRLCKWLKIIFDHHLPQHLSFPSQVLHKFTLMLKINTMFIASSCC